MTATWEKTYRQLEALNWPSDVFVLPADFEEMRYASPLGAIPVSTDALGEYFWFQSTRIRALRRKISLLNFQDEDSKCQTQT